MYFVSLYEILVFRFIERTLWVYDVAGLIKLIPNTSGGTIYHKYWNNSKVNKYA